MTEFPRDIVELMKDIKSIQFRIRDSHRHQVHTGQDTSKDRVVWNRTLRKLEKLVISLLDEWMETNS